MRPYLAILKDSFREAVASRTLPFLLVFFTIVLGALAPIGMKEEVPWRLRPTDLADVRLLAIKLRGETAQPGDTPAKRVLDRLPENLKTRLIDPNGIGDDKPPPNEPFGATRLQRDLADAVNDRVLSDDKFYAPDAWKNRVDSDELKDLSGRKSLSTDETRRRNRLAFDAAFPGAVMSAPKSSAELTWFGGEIPLLTQALRDASVDRAEVQKQAQGLLQTINSSIVGPIGLLVAIFVTSTIIPRMFEPGAIDLLLSKPVSRTGLYLTRFFSGCAFVLITFSYFIAGLWLIVGVRLGVWNNGLLLAIPLLLFAFAVIYSVSAATGVVWRNPIVSVFVAVLVWGAGFLIGVTRDTMGTLRNGDKAREIVPAGNTLLVSDKNGHVYQWSSSSKNWDEVFKGGGPPMMAGLVYPLIGPVYDPKGDRIIAGDVGPGGSQRLVIGTRESGWERSDGAAMPPSNQYLFVTDDGRLLAAGQAGLFRFQGEPSAKAAQWMLWGLNLAPKDKTNAFVRVDTDRTTGWGRDMAATVDRRSGGIVVADKGHLVRFKPSGSSYVQIVERDLKNEKPAVIGQGGGQANGQAGGVGVVAFADGAVYLFDAVGLGEAASFRLPKDDPPRSAQVSSDGRRAAVLTHGGRLFLYDADSGKPISASIRGQGDISAIAFAPGGTLWVADRLKRLSRYDTETFTLKETLEGSLSTGEMIYRYALRPLQWVLPNTYGLRNAQTYLFTESKSEAVRGPDAPLDSERLTLDVWGPIWQNAAFLAVILGLTCVYIARKDF